MDHDCTLNDRFGKPSCMTEFEQEIREDERSNNFTPDDFSSAMTEAYQRGLDAAREAVLGAKAVDVAYGRGLDEPAQFIWLNNALSAIDALREEQK
jgi:hypothetical protein